MMIDEPLRLGAVGSAILTLYYGSLAGSLRADALLRARRGRRLGHLHQAWIDKITKSIESAGDGSREKPYPVISASEARSISAHHAA